MLNDVLTRIEEASGFFAERADTADELGRLPDDTVKRLKESGLVRLLQPAEFGGYEADPRDFFSAVMDVSRCCPSAGWVAGVVGVHPWELALNDERLQSEVWGEEPDTWIASPYAPSGVAVPVDGGYEVNGRWAFSSGTDHCDWVVLGAIVPGDDGAPVGALHIMLPRSDYQIVDDSWNAMGLVGTGSKDVIVQKRFVPSYRTIDVAKVMDGRAAADAGRHQPLYRLPWSAIFPNAVAASVVGIAEGVLRYAIEYQKGRVSVAGVAQVSDPYSRATIGEAAADIRGARVQLLYNVGEMYDSLQAGCEPTLEQRVAGRRDQVRVAWRAAHAADEVFALCGGNAIRLDQPLQRLWRGLHAGLNHAIFVPGPVYDAAAGVLMGQRLEGRWAATF